MNKIKNISSFDKIKINKKSLIFCDIDETLLKFEGINHQWWDKKLQFYNKKYNNNIIASEKCYNLWLKKVKFHPPLFTDEKGFFTMFENILKKESDLFFITARPPEMEDITIQHFKLLNIDFLQEKICFVGNYSKGKFIKENFNFKKYKNIIFIDDLLKNINAVNQEDKNILLYKFNMI